MQLKAVHKILMDQSSARQQFHAPADLSQSTLLLRAHIMTQVKICFAGTPEVAAHMFDVSDTVSCIKTYVAAQTGLDVCTFQLRARHSAHGAWFLMAEFESLDDVADYHAGIYGPAIDSPSYNDHVRVHTLQIEQIP